MIESFEFFGENMKCRSRSFRPKLFLCQLFSEGLLEAFTLPEKLKKVFAFVSFDLCRNGITNSFGKYIIRSFWSMQEGITKKWKKNDIRACENDGFSQIVGGITKSFGILISLEKNFINLRVPGNIFDLVFLKTFGICKKAAIKNFFQIIFLPYFTCCMHACNYFSWKT